MVTTILIIIGILCLICFAGALVVRIIDDYGLHCGMAAMMAFVVLCVLVGLFMLKGLIL